MTHRAFTCMPFKVLHVDDDPMILELVKGVLEAESAFRVWSFESGAAAIDAAAQVEPDLILMDMVMPGMKGTETLAALRRVPACRETPAIFLTSSLKPSEISTYYDHSAIGYIAKPFDLTTLEDQILSLMKADRIISKILV